jgi:tetratricopeptide (TPR) repeat protein
MTTAASIQDLRSALEQAGRLLQSSPADALQRARTILTEHPNHAAALQLEGSALRLLGQPGEALKVLVPLEQMLPDNASLQHQLGLCQGALGHDTEAEQHLRKAVKLDPALNPAWLALSNQLESQGDSAGSQAALERYLQGSTSHPELVEAAHHLQKGRIARAEPLVREVLKKAPNDVSALRMLAEIATRIGRFEDARNLLGPCLELAPDFTLARQNYANVLRRLQHLPEALEQTEILLSGDPDNPRYLILKGSVLTQLGDHEKALEIFEHILNDYPKQAPAQLSYGHNLKTLGRIDESVLAYRRAIEITPTTGEAYWSLANLKIFRFTDEDIAAMRAALESGEGDADDRSHLAFALGKALEDRKEYDESFRYYDLGNSIRGKEQPYDPKKNMYNAVRQVKTCTAEFFQQQGDGGCPAPDPIFVVGLPRAGSTLLEQILASHSQVEGTTELPDIIAISRRLGARSKDNPASLYPEILRDLTSARRTELGEGYLDSTRAHRVENTPFFIDKMPNNFLHIGLIHLILPNARIIDARRQPMAACFACYKQLFARGQTFTYDLRHVAHYYRNYVNVMDHWDKVLPGRIHRVQYEHMVADSETEIRRLLDYCGLPFEEQCLRYYETDRAVRTPSAEQVRQPIYQEALEQWRNYEHHLEPLKRALGPLLERYPI